MRDCGTPAGDDTLLRTYWNNQATGLVNDEVFYGAGVNNVPVFRITVWDGWTRQTGTVELKP